MIIPAERPMPPSVAAWLLGMTEKELRTQAQEGKWDGAFFMEGTHYRFTAKGIEEAVERRRKSND